MNRKTSNKSRLITTVAALLALFTLASLISSCSAPSGDTGETTAAVAETTTDAVAETTAAAETLDIYSIPDTIPDGLNFGGIATVLYWKSVENEWVSDQVAGDTILDAIYTKNENVKRRLGIELEFIETPGNNSNLSKYVAVVEKDNKSGENKYTLISAYSRTAMSCATSGLVQDIACREEIKLESPWYCHSAVDAATVGNKTFCVAGGISHSYLSRMAGCFFNVDLLNSRNLDDPYVLVVENKWTLDKFKEITTDLYVDLDGDGQVSVGDQFGLVTDSPQVDCLQYSSGIVICDFDENHIPRVSEIAGSDRMITTIDKWIDIMKNGYLAKTDDTSMFVTGRAAFYCFPLALVSSAEMREVSFKYGFVPQPKFDENQENYICSLTNYFSYWSIPAASANVSLSAYLMECMSSEGFKNVVPAVFEVSYKYKYSTDSRQGTIFDMMRENVHVDFGKVNTVALSNIPSTLFRDIVISGTNTFTAQWKSSSKLLESSLQKSIETLTGQ